ncbi:MAG: hypothetical protein AAF944_00105 [Bacteroidota bacterium]
MKKQREFPLRNSSRYLSTFKVAIIVSVTVIALFYIWLFINSFDEDWVSVTTSLLLGVSMITLLISALLRLKYYRNVIWDDDHLIVKDKVDIIIPLNEIREVELKTLNGVHEVHLLEEHPYLGESFLFLGSLNYFFRHKKIDLTIQSLNKRIAQAKREAA